MKDLKHYFTENVKGCEAGSNGDTREVTRELVDVEASANGGTEIPEARTRRKRGRVKIKISQTNADGRVCDIVESKNDSIDKTPSPFAAGCGRDVGTDESTKHDTPRRSSSLPRKTVKDGLVEAAVRGRSSLRSPNEERNSGDENDNSIANSEKKNGGSPASFDGRNVPVESAAGTRADVFAVEREESNAFQVLMTRKKPVQYIAPTPMSPEDEELAAKVARESKIKVKQNREKLVALADKKGYSKRKLGEMEEAEKIERRLEKRARVFSIDGKKEEDEERSPSSGRIVVPGSLHNYFSKATPEQKEKELTAVSTLVVKAEVHVRDCINEGEAKGMAEEKTAAKTPKVDAREATEMINDIQILESENLGSLAANAEEGKSPNQGLKKKPRWSLRINLQSKDQDELADPIVLTDDKVAPGRRDSRPRKSKVKLTNYENEGSESDSSNVKITKKKKSASTAQKNKTPRSKADAEPLDSYDDSLPIIVDVVLSNRTVAAQIDEPEIIVINETKRQTSGKLAPLFVKKQKPDPAVLEARRLFLQSVPAENGNQRTERRVPSAGVPFLPFPTISHVAQHSGGPNVEPSPLECKFPLREKCPFTPSYNLNEFRSVISLDRESEKKSQDRPEMTKGNLEEVLGEIESRCSDAREIWKRISTTIKSGERRKSPKIKSKKRKSSEKKSENILAEEKIDHDGIWTDKYRPMSSREIVGNEEAAKKLHTWLNGWKTPLRGEDNSSGDEFYSSDCSYASDSNQVAVLLGPHGSGKTASVYAIANELGYSVLEVNASSKRAGKKLLKELEEATKSHRIKKSEGISLLPTPKEKKTTPQNSLILVEDVDLIFEEDEGFITATCQLASNTKRPIVMTGRDTCLHLNRMAPQQLRIYYQATEGSRVSALLELITLAESGYRLPQPCLDRLLQSGDLRKALLQLQYLLLSGQPRASEVPTNCHRSLWQDMRRSLYKPAIRGTKKKLPKKNLVNSEKPSLHPKDKSVVTGLANDLETLSLLTTLIEVDDPALDVMSLKFEPSVSLVENTHSYSDVSNTSAEIAKWLRDRAMGDKGSNDPDKNDLQIMRQLSLKKELNAGVNLALSQVSPLNLDGRIMTLDYLPSLRAMCRAEDLRISTNNKRGNRFFHYLQNLRLPSTSMRPNILAAACKMMRDKNSES